jgi:hypothetical protein
LRKSNGKEIVNTVYQIDETKDSLNVVERNSQTPFGNFEKEKLFALAAAKRTPISGRKGALP